MSALAQFYKRPSDEMRPEHFSHIKGDGNYSHIYFTDGSMTTFGRTLKRFEIEYPYLIRITKSLLINPSSITDWKRWGATSMKITTAGVDYVVSRRRVQQVMIELVEALSKSTT